MGMKPERERALLAFGLLALAMTSGCFEMAVPPALNLARAAISGISSSVHAAKNNRVAQDTELCDVGERPLPGLIELKTDQLGKTMYRTLKPGGPTLDQQAPQAAGRIGALGQWRAMGDLSAMHFEPPLQSQLIPSSIIFLAYAPAQVHGPAEQSQSDALSHEFAPIGTFDSDNRLYFYSVVHQLPCESPRSPEPAQASGGSPRPESPEEPEQPDQPRPLAR